MIFKGIRSSIAKKPFIFVIFLEGGPDPLSPSGSAHGFAGGPIVALFHMLAGKSVLIIQYSFQKLLSIHSGNGHCQVLLVKLLL